MYSSELCGSVYYDIWYTILAAMLCSTRSVPEVVPEAWSIYRSTTYIYVLYINKGNCITPQSIICLVYPYNWIAASVRGLK